MLKAEEARKIAKEKRESEMELELERVEDLIKSAAEEGEELVDTEEALSSQAVKVLQEAGYEVFAEKGKFSRILWKEKK